MKHQTLRLAPLALALALAGGFAAAQTSTPSSDANTGSSMTGGKSAPAAQPATGTRNSDTSKASTVARADRKFMDKAAGGGMFEVEAGKLAQSKAENPDVKNYGKTLVDDHSAANDELVKLANNKHVELPAAPPHAERREMEKLGKLSGDKFDHEFLEMAVKDHKKDIKEFETASSKIKDPEVKAWIDRTLPHLRAHLDIAQKLVDRRNNAAAMGNRGEEMQTVTRKGAATGANTGLKKPEKSGS